MCETYKKYKTYNMGDIFTSLIQTHFNDTDALYKMTSTTIYTIKPSHQKWLVDVIICNRRRPTLIPLRISLISLIRLSLCFICSICQQEITSQSATTKCFSVSNNKIPHSQQQQNTSQSATTKHVSVSNKIHLSQQQNISQSATKYLSVSNNIPLSQQQNTCQQQNTSQSATTKHLSQQQNTSQ